MHQDNIHTARPKDIEEKLTYIIENANFLHEVHKIKDGVPLWVFVRH